MHSMPAEALAATGADAACAVQQHHACISRPACACLGHKRTDFALLRSWSRTWPMTKENMRLTSVVMLCLPVPT